MAVPTNRLATARVLAGTVAGAVVGYLAVVDPNRPGHYPPCPIRWATGWYCPGCGGLRAVHDLLHGRLGAAADANVLVVLAVPVLVGFGVWWVAGSRPVPPARWWWLSAAVVLAYGVARNLPFSAGLAP